MNEHENEAGTNTDRGRRAFLKLAGAGAPAAALVAATGAVAADEVVEPAAAGLRKTTHVRKYLETARF